ncbi:MAG: hypothetical protein NKF70_00140 [Methanobacterium sp. ERen5]|nr:MAG: hypothetical protein NKF70_00140 [Methanobacterium sp. ERen5]
MNKGVLTTVVSDIALGVSGIVVAKTLTPDLISQIVIASVILGIAILDVKYPEFMDKLSNEISGDSKQEYE